MGGDSTISDPPDLLLRALAPSYQEETQECHETTRSTGVTEINLQKNL